MIGALLAMAFSNVDDTYSEPLRPQFHFTAQKGWLNDPNGLVYFKGEYHLFFQHNPFGTQWGNMTWGHATSKDLIHWRQLPEAIAPDNLGTIFSGSAVVDKDNTAGFGKNALACMYTAAGGTNELSKGQLFTQCLAYSLDGRNFSKFSGNPVLPHIEAENRDPKVSWYAPTKSWILALYLNGNRYALFSSPDLKSWKQVSSVDMPGASECPDFFELAVDGDKNQRKWVFWGASGNYRVGRFDGTTFTPETDSIRSNFGNTGYASQTYFNDPKGRRVQISWFNNSEFPGTAWNQQMGFPAELTLRSTPSGPRLCTWPVDEIKGLRQDPVDGKDGAYKSANGLLDVTASFTVPPEGTLTLAANEHPITYDATSHVLEVLGKKVEVSPEKGKLELRILIDRASIEIYVQHGLVNIPLFALPGSGVSGFSVQAKGDWKERIEVWSLKSAWKS